MASFRMAGRAVAPPVGKMEQQFGAGRGPGPGMNPLAAPAAAPTLAGPAPGRSPATPALEAPAPKAPPPHPDEHNPIRRVALFFGLGLILVRISSLHEILTWQLGVNLRLLYIFGPPAILGVLMCGGIPRTFRDGKPMAHWWLAFVTWLVLAIPTSEWRGGSVTTVFTYIRFEYLMMFVVAGLVVTWKEFRKVLWVMLGITALAMSFSALGSVVDARATLAQEFKGTIANSNDYATHLLFCLPFLLLVVLSPSWNKLVRFASLCGMGISVLLAMRTGSRGAMLSLGVGVLFVLWKGSGRLRGAVIVMTPIAIIALLALLPDQTRRRLMSVVGPEQFERDIAEAVASQRQRTELLKTSIRYTLERPIFGVGPGQFASYEGGESTQEGRRGMWHETHNAYTQVSSENGIPALIFYLGGIIAAYRRLSRIHQAAQRAGIEEVVTISFCMMLTLAMFSTSMFFLTIGYRSYLPLFLGMVIAFGATVTRQFPQLLPPPRPNVLAGAMHPAASAMSPLSATR